MDINKEPIYTITTVRSPSLNSRCVGFFHELETAIKAVEDNDLDISEEGYYHYAVIEKVGPGFYNLSNIDVEEHEIWFRWRNGGYDNCFKPDQFKRTVCFGIG